MVDKKIKIKLSKIHGEGVFASKDIKKGEVVLKWNISNTLSKEEIEKLNQEERKYICFLDEKFIVMQEPERFINHSCDPNTISKNFSDIANRDIKKEEEITSDYSKVSSGGPTIKCNCRSPKCIGLIKS
jgi:uncharacterized protein